jgi:uncharacterized protein (TIGR02391 family)
LDTDVKKCARSRHKPISIGQTVKAFSSSNAVACDKDIVTRMSIFPLKSIFATADEILGSDEEPLAMGVLEYIEKNKDVSAMWQIGQLSKTNFRAIVSNDERVPIGLSQTQPEYGDRQPEVAEAVMGAFDWLVFNGYLGKSGEYQQYKLTRKAINRNPPVERNSVPALEFIAESRLEELGLAEGNSAYLPKNQLHPVIADKPYAAFLRGDYDGAIFQAFRAIEIAVRRASKLSKDLVGDQLMRAAFASPEKEKPTGPLTDTHFPVGEQRSMAHLFAGTFGVFRNSTAHRNFRANSVETAEIIMFASYLMRVVDRLKSKPLEGVKT